MDYILCYMKQEVERLGTQIDNAWFDFSFSRLQRYLNAKDEVIPDGEDLSELKKHYPKVKNNQWQEALKICFTHQYIQQSPYEPDYKKIHLTDKGMARAISVSNSTSIGAYIKKFSIGIGLIVGILTIILYGINIYDRFMNNINQKSQIIPNNQIMQVQNGTNNVQNITINQPLESKPSKTVRVVRRGVEPIHFFIFIIVLVFGFGYFLYKIEKLDHDKK